MGRHAYCSVATNGDTAYGHKATNGKSPTVMGQPTAGRLHFTLGGFQRHIHLFFGTASAVLFSWLGVARWLVAIRERWRRFSPCSACGVAVDFVDVLRGGLAFRLVFCPFSARFRCRRVFVRPSRFRAFLPRFRACFGVLRVCRSVRLFLACRFWAFFGRFLARCGLAWIFIQGNKKSPFKGQFSRRFRFCGFRA